MAIARGPAALAVVCAAWLASRLRSASPPPAPPRNAHGAAWDAALARFRAHCAADESPA